MSHIFIDGLLIKNSLGRKRPKIQSEATAEDQKKSVFKFRRAKFA